VAGVRKKGIIEGMEAIVVIPNLSPSRREVRVGVVGAAVHDSEYD